MILLLMGVSGSGKTTVANALKGALKWDFLEGDLLHPPSNIKKMAANKPLTSGDRAFWLYAIREKIKQALAKSKPLIVTCSCLKANYQTYLVICSKVKLIYLKGDKELITARLKKRKNHFFPWQLLNSQFAALEEPTPKTALIVDITASLDDIVAHIRSAFHL